jgi:hypothetical protein
MMPQQIGFAAAYEAYRQIRYRSNVYNHLYTDYELQRAALRALAIAEGMSLSILLCLMSYVSFHLTKAARLWQDTGRGIDQYGLQMACDAAAATASHISTAAVVIHQPERHRRHNRHHHHHRRHRY